MRVMIVSDTHRKDENLKCALEREMPVDMLIHLGDSEGSEHLFQNWLPLSTRFVAIRGNNDFFSVLEKEREMRIGGHKIFLTHGHYYNVSLDTELLRQETLSRGCDIVMFGHTHKPLIEIRGGVTLLNPGSISYPRQDGRQCTYLMMETGGGKEPRYELKQLKTD